MNFKNTNSFNDRLNLLAANMLPIAGDDSAISLIRHVYNMVILLIDLIHTIAVIVGIVLVPPKKALKDGTICIVITLEIFILYVQFYTHRKLLKRVVSQLNDILSNADEMMKHIIKSTLKPKTKPFAMYGLVTTMAAIIWTMKPVTSAFGRDAFFYVDYNLPCAFSPEPFSRKVLVTSTVFMTIGSTFIVLKRFGLDMYIMHLVLMLTAQYRYTAEKLKLLFRELREDAHVDKTPSLGTNQRKERELRALCQHHHMVLRISFMLRELLSVNFSILYLHSVFRFCFIGILLSSIPSLPLIEAMSIVLFSLSSAVQFFFLCSSVQTLSDASTEITDKAFDEDWHQYGLSIKRIFLLLIIANNLECKLAAVEKFNLSLPSFMTVMNQSYSITLLLLRTN